MVASGEVLVGSPERRPTPVDMLAICWRYAEASITPRTCVACVFVLQLQVFARFRVARVRCEQIPCISLCEGS